MANANISLMWCGQTGGGWKDLGQKATRLLLSLNLFHISIHHFNQADAALPLRPSWKMSRAKEHLSVSRVEGGGRGPDLGRAVRIVDQCSNN